MRKKTVNHLADTIFWYLLYFLPVVGYCLYLIAEPSGGTNVISLSTFFESAGVGFVTDNAILTGLKSLFYTGGVFPIFTTDAPFFIFTWFVGVFICHLAVDFLLFIPRLCHKYMSKFTQGD